MNRESIILLSLTAVVAALAAGLAFVVLRLFAAAKRFRSTQQGSGAETAFMAAAMEEAVAKLRSREQAMVARAEASRTPERRDHRQPDVGPARRRTTTGTSSR